MIRRALAAAGVMVAVLGIGAAPAAAHGGPGGGDAPASNYRSRVLDIAPAIEGLTVRTIEAGSRLELVNGTGRRVTVLGYEGEPYLRIGSDGVHENIRSPAVYLNEERNGRAEVPEHADPDAAPEWRRVDDGPSVRWHDHRAHWMGDADPPAVRRDPGSEHVIDQAWEVPLDVGGREVRVTGDLTWVPGPSPWPPYVAALVLAVGVGATAWTSRWRLVVTTAVSALLIAAVVDAAGVWAATAEPAEVKFAGLSTLTLCALLAVAGIVLVRRSPREGLSFIGAAGAAFLLLFGVANVDWFARSQLPTALAPLPARLTVVASLGLGAGCVIVAVAGVLRSRSDTGSTASATPIGTCRAREPNRYTRRAKAKTSTSETTRTTVRRIDQRSRR